MHQMAAAEFVEKKNFPLAVVQQTQKLAREAKAMKPPINFNQQHLLHQTQSSLSSAALHHQQLRVFQPPQVSFHQQQLQLVQSHVVPSQLLSSSSKLKSNQLMRLHKQQMIRQNYALANNNAEKSDPENHIYEMIDEDEVSVQNFVFPNHSKLPLNEMDDEVRRNDGEGGDLFQNLLRAEVMNQMRLHCNNGIGYLSHLTQQKRMDVIQETALSLATAAYVEK
jgi:hypothetical protein